LAHERNWVPMLLTWLNLHDRPAVQVEALLALTNIAELCAQQSYFQHTAQQTSAVAAAAQAAVSAVKGTTPSWNDAMDAASKYAPSKYPYPSLVAPAPGSVPFPPLSFSQTLSPDAVAAFDASLTLTIQSSNLGSGGGNSSSSGSGSDSKRKAIGGGKQITAGGASGASAGNSSNNTNGAWTMPSAPLFPAAPALPGTYPAAGNGGINFTSLAPPPGGAHSSVPSNAFLPPPTPVAGQTGGSLSFPQQLSASSQHLLLRHADAIPTLISLLSSPNREVYEQAMWILGSIAAGDSPGGASTGSTSTASSLDGRDKSVSARDVILAAGVMNQLLRCLESHPTNVSLQRIGSWTLSNLVDGIFQQSANGKNGGKSTDYSSADEIEMSLLLPVLRRLLRTSDSEVLSYTCWTLSHLCDGPSSHIAAVVTTKDTSKAPKGGLVPRLVELLMHASWRVTKPALRTIGNIVCAECSDDNHGSTATTDYTEVILECDAVPRLKELVAHNNREIQKEACWTLSNIAAGTVDQIQAVIDSGAIPPLVKLVRDKKTDQEVRSEACWVVLNATSCGSDSQIEVLVDEGCVSVLGVLLSEASMVMMALEGLERVLQVEETREIIRREQIENGDIEDDDDSRTPTLVNASLIEKARESHNSSAVTKRADRIWKQHFVSCALCSNSYSKHRTSDASFCEECKCHVCCNCNCNVYHLDYQEELWAATEEKTEAKKTAKKSKNKKKKEKLKKKKASHIPEPEVSFGKNVKKGGGHASGGKDGRSRSSIVSESSDLSDSKKPKKEEEDDDDEKLAAAKKDDDNISPSPSFDGDDGDDEAQNQIDFVQYLQQTGSIIALAKLMDALEYGGDYDEELDDYELKMIREQQQLLKGQATH
jgi:importin subunit alpha-1